MQLKVACCFFNQNSKKIYFQIIILKKLKRQSILFFTRIKNIDFILIESENAHVCTCHVSMSITCVSLKRWVFPTQITNQQLKIKSIVFVQFKLKQIFNQNKIINRTVFFKILKSNICINRARRYYRCNNNCLIDYL